MILAENCQVAALEYISILLDGRSLVDILEGIRHPIRHKTYPVQHSNPARVNWNQAQTHYQHPTSSPAEAQDPDLCLSYRASVTGLGAIHRSSSAPSRVPLGERRDRLLDAQSKVGWRNAQHLGHTGVAGPKEV
jgi:hypothetical protein